MKTPFNPGNKRPTSQRVFFPCAYIRNQDTFFIALTQPPPPPRATHQNWKKRKIEADRSCTTLCTEIHEPIIHTVQIDKGNFYFFSICKNKTLKIMIYVFENYFKNRNIYRTKFLKIGMSRFLEVLKVKIGTVPIKSGRLAGIRVSHTLDSRTDSCTIIPSPTTSLDHS